MLKFFKPLWRLPENLISIDSTSQSTWDPGGGDPSLPVTAALCLCPLPHSHQPPGLLSAKTEAVFSPPICRASSDLSFTWSFLLFYWTHRRIVCVPYHWEYWKAPLVWLPTVPTQPPSYHLTPVWAPSGKLFNPQSPCGVLTGPFIVPAWGWCGDNTLVSWDLFLPFSVGLLG